MSLRSTLRALPTLLRVGFAEAVAYRAEFLVWMLTTTMPLVMLALWTAVARDGAGRRASASRSFVAYYLATFVVRQLTGAWAAWQMNLEIRAGHAGHAPAAADPPAVGLRGGEPGGGADARWWWRCRWRCISLVLVRRAGGCRSDRWCWPCCCAVAAGRLADHLLRQRVRSARWRSSWRAPSGDGAVAGAVLRLLRLPVPGGAVPAVAARRSPTGCRSATRLASRWSC